LDTRVRDTTDLYADAEKTFIAEVEGREVPSRQPTRSSAVSTVDTLATSPTSSASEKRTFGLRRRFFWVLLVLILIIIILAAVVGGVVGARSSNNNLNGASSPSPTPSSAPSGAVPPSGTVPPSGAAPPNVTGEDTGKVPEL
jgi:hypothetical protein